MAKELSKLINETEGQISSLHGQQLQQPRWAHACGWTCTCSMNNMSGMTPIDNRTASRCSCVHIIIIIVISIDIIGTIIFFVVAVLWMMMMSLLLQCCWGSWGSGLAGGSGLVAELWRHTRRAAEQRCVFVCVDWLQHYIDTREAWHRNSVFFFWCVCGFVCVWMVTLIHMFQNEQKQLQTQHTPACGAMKRSWEQLRLLLSKVSHRANLHTYMHIRPPASERVHIRRRRCVCTYMHVCTHIYIHKLKNHEQ